MTPLFPVGSIVKASQRRNPMLYFANLTPSGWKYSAQSIPSGAWTGRRPMAKGEQLLVIGNTDDAIGQQWVVVLAHDGPSCIDPFYVVRV